MSKSPDERKLNSSLEVTFDENEIDLDLESLSLQNNRNSSPLAQLLERSSRKRNFSDLSESSELAKIERDQENFVSIDHGSAHQKNFLYNSKISGLDSDEQKSKRKKNSSEEKIDSFSDRKTSRKRSFAEAELIKRDQQNDNSNDSNSR